MKTSQLIGIAFPSHCAGLLSIDVGIGSLFNFAGGQAAAQHAFDISTGGEPLLLISEAESLDF